MIPDDRPPQYHSYLLTIWEERGQDVDEPFVLRFGVEDVHKTHRRRIFTTFEQMVLFLKTAIVNLANE